MERYALTIKKQITTKSELVAASRVFKTAWQVNYQQLLPADQLANLDPVIWQKSLQRPGRYNLLAIYHGQVIGVASYGACRSPAPDPSCGELMAIYVLPAFQGRGVGTRLLLEAERGLAALGFAQARLWVLALNRHARHFYSYHNWQLTANS